MRINVIVQAVLHTHSSHDQGKLTFALWQQETQASQQLKDCHEGECAEQQISAAESVNCVERRDCEEKVDDPKSHRSLSHWLVNCSG